MKFSQKLKEMRKFRGLTQQELAEKAGLTKQIISNSEREYTMPNSERISMIAKALNLRLVSEIGFEIYQFTDEENIFLGMPSVASSGIVEYFTPLYFAWQQWKENDLLKLKGAFK